MATVTTTTPPADPGDQQVVLRGVGWDGYRRLLRLRGERPRPKMVYLDGDVYLMSPAYPHENLAERLGLFVMEVATGMRLPCIAAGQTTFRRKPRRGGVEGDRTYYFANVEPIRKLKGRSNIQLRRHPPPDLAIEVVHTHEADAAVEVWRRLGVPEVWVCGSDRLRVLTLQDDSRYVEVGSSQCLPFLTAADVHGWVMRQDEESDSEWLIEVRRWVAETLAPRAAGGRGE